MFVLSANSSRATEDWGDIPLPWNGESTLILRACLSPMPRVQLNDGVVRCLRVSLDFEYQLPLLTSDVEEIHRFVATERRIEGSS